mgnify:CR=1 FL=1
MKLIRLDTDSTEGKFNSYFNEDIQIDVNSKISLHSLSCETDYDNIVIDNNNNQIKYKLGDDAEHSIYLANNTYLKTNIQDLFNDIQNKLNDSLMNDNRNTKCITFLSNDATGNVSIGYNRNLERNFDQPGAPWTVAGNLQLRLSKTQVTANTGGYAAMNSPVYSAVPSGGDGSDGTAYMYTAHPWNKGASILQGRVKQNTPDAANNGFELCLVDINPNTLATDGLAIPEANIIFKLIFEAAGSPYKCKLPANPAFTSGVDAIAADTNVGGNSQNDILSIETFRKKIQFMIYKYNDGAPTLLIESDIPYNTDGSRKDLYPVLIFRSSGVQLSIDKFRASVAFPVITTPPTESAHDDLTAYPPALTGGGTTIKRSSRLCTFTIVGQSLYDALGYFDYTATGGEISQTGVGANIIAPNPFHLTSLADACIVEMVNLDLISYDSLHKGRRNILNVICMSDNQTSINYEMRNLLFIDIKNQKKRTLRNIQVNLLRHDLTPFFTRGKSSLVLLIK